MEVFIRGAARQFSVTSRVNNGATTHRRLIKFRHGPQVQQTASSGSSPSVTTQKDEPAIWDFQLPTRWRRPPISEEECAIINNGGPL